MKKKLLLLNLFLFLTSTALAELPDCFVKKGTWRETLIASREKLSQEESKIDAAEFAKTDIKLGDWYYAGIGNDYKHLSREVRGGKEVLDVNKPLKIREKQYKWNKLSGFKPDVVYDFTKLADVSEDEYILLRNTVTVPQDLPKGAAPAIAFSTAKGSLIIQNGGQARAVREGEQCVVLNGAAASIPTKKGTYPIVAVVDLSRNAQPYIWYHFTDESKDRAMDRSAMKERRLALFEKTLEAFKKDPASKLEMLLDKYADIWPTTSDWKPGDTSYIANQYKSKKQLAILNQKMEDFGPATTQALEPMVSALNEMKGETLEEAALKFALPAIILKVDKMAKSFKSMRLAINDQAKTFEGKYPNAKKYLAEVDALEKELTQWTSKGLSKGKVAIGEYAAVEAKITAAQQRILLDNPLLRFEKLLVASGGIRLSTNWGGACTMGRRLEVLSPVAPDGKLTTIHDGSISSYELDWDAKKILFSDGTKISEMDVDGQNLRVIKDREKGVDESSRRYNPCRTPNGDIMFVSTACEQAVPCTGGGGVANMHLMDKDGKNERRVTYDQDHNWDPAVLNNGRVVYTRWEYTDLPHYFSRLLMSMNPDGTDQKEYYGSASYWPNAMYWTRPIPGHPTKIVTIVSGHHGVSRMGEMHLFDPALGRQEADGSVQQIPGYGKIVEPRIADNLVGNSWPKFIAPYPLGTSPQKDGAGTYFLVSVKESKTKPWQLCLVDIFDNITPILTGDYAMPVPVLPRAKPQAVPSRVDLAKKTGTAMITDIYKGPGVQGFPKGSIKKLRVGTYHYRYPGNGTTNACSHQGGWDIRRIMGTVPVDEDGSAFFEVPANVPIFVQPLDADGQALQVMRSWFTCQPGENLACIGCHESQNMAPPATVSTAARRSPSKITPWNGPMRGFSFDREVQPVLDRKCVGCHDGSKKERPDFRAKRLHKDYEDLYSPAYMALQKYVRRAGFENDWHTPSPGEFQADTSHLMKLLKKGHKNVRLTRDEWDRLYTWIDFNIPYPANWSESHRNPNEKSVATREKMFQLYASIDDRIETTTLALPEIAKYEAPPKMQASKNKVTVKGWPIIPEVKDPKSEEQKSEGPKPEDALELNLGDDIKMKLVKVGAGEFVLGDPNGFADETPRAAKIDKPFYIGTTEVSLAQYKQFDPDHENKFIETRGKDQSRRGAFAMDRPNLPVVRISQDQATAFCEWLSQRTGKKVTLPSEEQWEWACRAGSDKPYSFGTLEDMGKDVLLNIAGGKTANWNYGRAEKFNDGCDFVNECGNKYPANAWGLYDMHGNVAEWTTTDYQPLKDVGGAKGTEQIPYKVVKGGSWNDLAKFATSASRWRYPKHQPVYNVGFRVVVEEEK